VQPLTWRLEKFKGNPPTKFKNALLRSVGYGPKLPFEVIEWRVDHAEHIFAPLPSRWWFMYHVVQWIVRKWHGIT
jgi:hypothetical protein